MAPILLLSNLMKASYLLGFTILSTGFCLPASADLIVEQVLGPLEIGSTISIRGDTATGNNNADTYFAVDSTDGPNWGNELVFRFTITQEASIWLTFNSLTGDPDAFLLSDINTSTDSSSGKDVATGSLSYLFLDSAPTGSFGTFLPGTYYLSIDSYIGSDLNEPLADATFEFALSIREPSPAPAAADLGVFGDESDVFTIDTLRSTLESGDTELGLFDSFGELLDSNDDADGSLLSALTFGPLPSGEYYIAVGEFNTDFAREFTVTGAGGTGGRFFLNHPNGSNSGNLGDGVAAPDVIWYRFAVLPELGLTPWLIPENSSPLVLDLQTALFKQTLTVTNISPFTLSAFRVLIDGLPEGVTVYNAQGESDGRSFLLYNQPLASGESVELVVEYFQADASGGFKADFDIELLEAVEVATSVGGAQLQRIESLPNGDKLLEFLSTPGDSYTVQYSHNGEDWFDVLPAVIAGANVTQWVDNGPPKTPSHPSTMKSRLYRVVHQSNAR